VAARLARHCTPTASQSLDAEHETLFSAKVASPGSLSMRQVVPSHETTDAPMPSPPVATQLLAKVHARLLSGSVPAATCRWTWRADHLSPFQVSVMAVPLETTPTVSQKLMVPATGHH
jgi:hypothetical protein